MRILANELKNHLSKTVSVSGWVNSRRDHGGLIFIDLRDHTGIIQLVITPENETAFKLAETLRDEFVISATGTMRERAPELKNPNIETGDIELVVSELTLLNKSEPLPVNTHDDGPTSGEEHRLRYRYLDLRRPSMQKMLRRRAEFYRVMRKYMDERDFVEITTPIMANSSPEGARDFIIPSRVHPGKFYALPQAPQQFKQLLMVGGVPRYYQIAPCFRDEDPRADRLYGDFYQLDLEMAFVDDGEVVRQEVEPLMKSLVTDFAGKKLLSEDIPRISYQEAMEKYGTDKPDLRYGLGFVELTDTFKNTDFKVFQSECVKAICVPGGATLSRKQIDDFTDLARKTGAGGLAYILYENGEARSPITKFMSETELVSVQKFTGAKDGDAVFFGADTRKQVNKTLGELRIAFAEHFQLADPNVVALCWVVDFPFYEWDEGAGKLDFGHNPFSLPKGGLEALKGAEKVFAADRSQVTTEKERATPVTTGCRDACQQQNLFAPYLAVLADQYDMVMNGQEICSGAVRNYNPEIMYKAFGILGYDEKYVAQRFGGMLNAFKFGAPPHAGCAFGLERIFMVLENITNIRDVVAFPKNGSGVDLMMDSPSEVEPELLRDAHIELTPEDD